MDVEQVMGSHVLTQRDKMASSRAAFSTSSQGLLAMTSRVFRRPVHVIASGATVSAEARRAKAEAIQGPRYE